MVKTHKKPLFPKVVIVVHTIWWLSIFILPVLCFLRLVPVRIWLIIFAVGVLAEYIIYGITTRLTLIVSDIHTEKWGYLIDKYFKSEEKSND